MNQSLVLFLYSFVLFLQPCFGQCPQNLLLNAGFENGFTGTPVQIGWSITVPGISISTDATSGTRAAQFCNNPNGIRLFQMVSVLPNTDYIFEAKVKGGSPSGQCLMFLKFMDAGFTPLLTEYIQITMENNYKLRSGMKKSPAGATRLEVGFLNYTPTCLLIDETCLRASSVPVPCAITAQANDIVCNNAGTPNVATDDYFQCKITVNKSSGCNLGNTWTATGGNTGNYGTAATSANFLISAGNPTLQITDAGSPSTFTFLTIQAPSTCSTPTGGNCDRNLLTNPGFEQQLNGWVGVGVSIKSESSAGSNSLKICTGQSIRQTVALGPDKAISLQFKAKRDDPAAKVLAYVKFLNSSWFPLQTEYKDVTPTNNFTNYTTTVTGPNDAVWVEIGFLNSNLGCSLLDEVCLSTAAANLCSPDTQPPVFSSCPSNQSILTGGTSATATWVAPVATDACGPGVNVVGSQVSGAAFAVGATTVTYTATDAALNSAICSFIINVQSIGNPGGTCGFLRAYPASTPFGSDIKAIETSNGQYQVWGLQGIANNGANVATLITEPNGNALYVGQNTPVLLPGTQAFWGPDSSLVYAAPVGVNTVFLTRINQSGTAFWQSNIPFTPLFGQTATGLQVAQVLTLPDGYLVIGTAISSPFFGSSFLNTSRFLIKTDQKGIKVWQTNQPWVFSEFGNYAREVIRSNDGSFYLRSVLQQNFFSIEKFNPSGNLVWTASGGRLTYPGEPVLMAAASDDSGVFVTTQTNAIITKYNASNGFLLWSQFIGTLFSQQNIQISCILPTSDAALLVSYQFTNQVGLPENAFSKITGAGAAVWTRPFAAQYITQPVYQLANGGFLLAGNAGASRVLVRTTPEGIILPDCGTGGGGGGSNQPDLELTMFASRTTVPKWSTVTVTVRVKNNGQAAVQNALIRLGQCSNTGYTFQNTNKLVYAATPSQPASKGSYNYYGQEWTLSQLAAGETADLQIELYTLAATNYTLMAWTAAQSPADADSQPSTPPFLTLGSNCVASQDDEALVRFGASLLMSSRPNTQENTVDPLENWLIYPNPATDFITIESGVERKTKIYFSIMSPLGITEKAWSEEVEPQQQISVSTEGLQSGTYFLRIVPEGMRATTKKVSLANRL
jgi:hypothetical protein